MSEYHIYMLVAALIAAGISWKTPRALMWIGILAASFIVSVAYLYMPKPEFGLWWPPQPGIAMLCDAAVIFAIYELGRENWETVWLRTVVMLSVTVNLLQTFAMLVGYPPVLSGFWHGTILEILNYLALLIIGGQGLQNLLGAVKDGQNDIYGNANNRVSSAGHATHKEKVPSRPFRHW